MRPSLWQFRPALLAALLLLNACHDHDRAPPAAGQGTPVTVDNNPDYWPTADWQSATPESQGFTPGSLDTLAEDAAAALPYHTSLLVIRNGWLVHESYHDTTATTDDGPVTADTRHHVWSITKSVTSLTLGRAMTLGDLTEADLEATAGNSLPAAAFNGIAADDPRRDIRLRHVLQMRSGLAWNEGAWLLQAANDPMLRALYGLVPNCPSGDAQILCSILQQPLAYTPGTVWNYNTYDSYLISGFFKELSGKRLSEYADLNLFAELGIPSDATDWWDLPSAYTFGGGLLHIRSRDLAKVGMLTLYGGRWADIQVIDAAWLENSLAAQGDGEIAAFDGSGNPSGTTATTIPYGLQWWQVTGPHLGGTPSISARGLAGQMMHIFRDKELIIIITCDSSPTTEREPEINEFLRTHILEKIAT